MTTTPTTQPNNTPTLQNNQIDILNFLVMPSSQDAAKLGLSYNRDTNNLGSFDSVNMTPDPNGYIHWDHIKSANGYPWDRKLIDNNGVYDWITEISGPGAPPPSPNNYKKFIQNHTDDGGKTWKDGVKMFPRFINKNFNHITVLTAKAQSQYYYVTNCTNKKTLSLGNILHILDGPFLIDNGGNIGLQPTLIHTYVWDASNPNSDIEVNYYVLNFGWTRWMHCVVNPNTGLYEIAQPTSSNLTIHNNININPGKPPACPKINFPCF